MDTMHGMDKDRNDREESALQFTKRQEMVLVRNFKVTTRDVCKKWARVVS